MPEAGIIQASAPAREERGADDCALSLAAYPTGRFLPHYDQPEVAGPFPQTCPLPEVLRR
jgi:hypothetical protein